ncbi:MAG: hypothetical protein ACP5OA_03275 [Candidatus Woesearchaeota archaeon]
MAMRTKTVGIIAEDQSDVDCFKVIIRRITANSKIKFLHHIGKGCGRIANKANRWAANLVDTEKAYKYMLSI